jgi:hypothetical protein
MSIAIKQTDHPLGANTLAHDTHTGMCGINLILMHVNEHTLVTTEDSDASELYVHEGHETLFSHVDELVQ